MRSLVCHNTSVVDVAENSMSDEITAIANVDGRVLMWSPSTLYREFGGSSTPVILWQINKPIYCRSCVGATNKLMAYGTYMGTTSRVYRVYMASATTFMWSSDGGATYNGPVTVSRHGHMLDYGISIQFYATEGFTVDDNWAFQVYPSYFTNLATPYMRWALAKWRNGYFFSNPLNEVKFTDGDVVQNLASNCDFLPKAKYLELFHEHLVAGNVTYNGTLYPERVMWSDIHDMTNYAPDPTNEADFYDLSLDESVKEISYGLTGVKNLNGACFVYGPKEIIKLNYVGLPRVMVKDDVKYEIGNAFPYALVGSEKFHAFISDENFYVFDGANVPKAIGDPIKDFFFSDLATTPEYRYRVWSYINRVYSEIWWVYVSTVSEVATPAGLFDKAVVWNFKDNVWFTASVENIQSYMEVALRNEDVHIDDAPNNARFIDAATEIIDTSGISATYSRLALYGTADRLILRDEVTADLIASLYAQTVPYLETKDIYYDDIEKIKEIDTLCLHATYDSTVCSGIEVYYSAREFFDDTVTYTKVDQLWTPALPEGKLSLPRVAGRILRFKFVFKESTVNQGVRGCIYSAWGENVRGPVPQEMEQ